MERLTLIRDEIAILAANTPDETNFNLKLGNFEWKAHADKVTRVPRHFDILCNGAFRMSEDRVVQLFDDNPFDVARLLHFFYTEGYDDDPDNEYGEGGTLEIFFPRNGFSPEELTAEEDRDIFEIHKDILVLADKHKVSSLSECIGVKLVGVVRQESRFEDFMKIFISAFRVIDKHLHELPTINDCLVNALYNCILNDMEFNGRDKHGRVCGGRKLPFMGSEGDTDEKNEKLQEFHKQMQEFVKGNGTFALEIVLRTHRILNKSFEYCRWSKV